MRYMVSVLLLVLAANPVEAAPHWQADITWTAVAPLTQTGFHVQRKLGLTGTYTTLTTTPLPATATSYRDVGPYQDGQVVCWRVLVQPQDPGGSNLGADTCVGAPIQYPGKPGAPAVNYQFIPN
jgi:hypothetical protein